MAEMNIIGRNGYMQNRELSWLDFNKRVLDQAADETVPLLERLNFVSIFWSNLQEFFMVRVGSLTDLSLVKENIVDTKSGMTPQEQLDAIYNRCYDLYTEQEAIYSNIRAQLTERGVIRLHPNELNKEQRAFLQKYARSNIMPFLSPQIVNSRHPFPHLENGAIYVLLRLNENSDANADPSRTKEAKATGKKSKNMGAKGVTLGLIPMPRQCQRVIQVPGEGFQYVLLEHAIEMISAEVFSMYRVKHTNIICVTRNADLDASESTDTHDYDYRDHMKRILKKRKRLAPVRLESEQKLSPTVRKHLLERLNLKSHQVYTTFIPLNMSYTFSLASRIPAELRDELVHKPMPPQWPTCLSRTRPIMEQVQEGDVLLSYPYDSMEPFIRLLQEAIVDPDVVSIKITLYRLASESRLAETLIAAAERGKEVVALFELRARFDEFNNIEWSQRFEEAGCKVIYGFRDYKVHSKICSITRQTKDGLQHITQLGTGNYNEKTARLYTDFSYITTDEEIGSDATEFFMNMALENASNNYQQLWVAPLQIKPMIIAGIDDQIRKAKAGLPCGLFFKTNSITDNDIMEKIAEASQAGVPTTLFVRGICCLIPGIPGQTDNVRVVSIVGRLLEHSRIYGFGPLDDMAVYLSSADLMTRNMDKRVEIAWPVKDRALRHEIIGFIKTCLSDTAKLRELMPDGTYTPLRHFAKKGECIIDAQATMLEAAKSAAEAAAIPSREPAPRPIRTENATAVNETNTQVNTAKVNSVATASNAAEAASQPVAAADSSTPLIAENRTKSTPASQADRQPTPTDELKPATAQPVIETIVPDQIEPPKKNSLVAASSNPATELEDDPSAVVRFLARIITRLKK